MKERPIIFSAAMVRAILDGRKTQTRRVIKPQPAAGAYWNQIVLNGQSGWVDGHGAPLACPYGKPGDRLWVRESFIHQEAEYEWTVSTVTPYLEEYTWYRADYEDDTPLEKAQGWTSPVAMPRWASRITLEITDIRVESLKDISEEDAIAEGVYGTTIYGERVWRNYLLSDDEAEVSPMLLSPIDSFRSLWESTHGKGSWDEPTFVWVREFKRIENVILDD